jgi:hypothetical protein
MEVVHALPDPLAAYTSDPASVHLFCALHGCLLDLQTALHLVEALFPSKNSPSVKVSKDAENDAEWLLIETTVDATPAEALSAYRRYVKEWVRAVPAERRSKIRLAYGIA